MKKMLEKLDLKEVKNWLEGSNCNYFAIDKSKRAYVYDFRPEKRIESFIANEGGAVGNYTLENFTTDTEYIDNFEKDWGEHCCISLREVNDALYVQSNTPKEVAKPTELEELLLTYKKELKTILEQEEEIRKKIDIVKARIEDVYFQNVLEIVKQYPQMLADLNDYFSAERA